MTNKTYPGTKTDQIIDIIVISAIALGLMCIISKTFLDFGVECVNSATLIFITGVVCLNFGRTFLRKGPVSLIKYHFLDLVIMIAFIILFSGIVYPAIGRIYYLLTEQPCKKENSIHKMGL
ncbi:MAG: hypothetical protein ABIG93_05100 [archaeon]